MGEFLLIYQWSPLLSCCLHCWWCLLCLPSLLRRHRLWRPPSLDLGPSLLLRKKWRFAEFVPLSKMSVSERGDIRVACKGAALIFNEPQMAAAVAAASSSLLWFQP